MRGLSYAAAALVFIGFTALSPTIAGNNDRTLRFRNTHTGERATITFKRNGVYDRDGLKEINHILRDWRRNEVVEMDPRLLDLVWEVYQQAGTTAEINIICGYRSPETNAALRRRSSGVAQNSQHTRGKALDFFIPGVELSRLREIGLRMQIGGVGFYPRSGSPFVHMDTGSVRHWPKMTRDQLVRVFPNGRTLHVPSDGRPLPGYAEAKAAYERRGQTVVALFGGPSRGDAAGAFAVAAAEPAAAPVRTAAPRAGREDGETAAPRTNIVASLFAGRSRGEAPARSESERLDDDFALAFDGRGLPSGPDEDAEEAPVDTIQTAALSEEPLAILPIPRRNPRMEEPVALAEVTLPVARPGARQEEGELQVLAFASPRDGTRDPLAMMVTDKGALPADAAPARTGRRAAPSAGVLRGWNDPLARTTFVAVGVWQPLPFLDADVSTRQAAFASLRAPAMPGNEFLAKPGQAYAPGFESSAYAEMRTDHFTGPSFREVAIVSFDRPAFRVAAR